MNPAMMLDELRNKYPGRYSLPGENEILGPEKFKAHAARLVGGQVFPGGGSPLEEEPDDQDL
jgi:hypothetical protein